MTKAKWIVLGVGFPASLLIAALIGLGLFKFTQYRRIAVPAFPAAGHPQVHITSPIYNSQTPYGSPLIVEATAISSSKIFSIELYLDGEIIGVQSAPVGGSEYFPAEFLFSPPGPGVYSLIARAHGVEQMKAYSPPVRIMITPPDQAPQAPAAADDGPGLTLPPMPSTAPDDQTSLAEQWQGTPGNWINHLMVSSPPMAPELAASPDTCSVILSIHDLSDNEEGFEVWRLLANSPTWARIDVLASQSQADWITYADSSAHGHTLYYVSAFNAEGSQDSNLVHAALDPVDCAPPTAGRSVLTFSLESLESDMPVDKLYCYVSPGGGLWMRRPEFGFWTRRQSAQGEGFFDVEIISMELAGDGGPEPGGSPHTIYLQCWGWLGDALHYLGEIAPSLEPDQQGSYQFGSDDSIAKVALNVGYDFSQVKFYPMDYEEEEGYELGVFDEGMQLMDPVILDYLDFFIDPTMPFVSSWITYSPEACKSHLPPPFQNQLGQFLFCTAFPGFDLGWEGANPQPYLVWGPNQVPMCIDGSGPNCKSYAQLVAQAADQGHELGFNIYDSNALGFYVHPVTAPELFAFVIPPVACSGSRTFWVQMWYHDSTNQVSSYGPPSGKTSIPCPYKLGPQMALDIRFDTLTVSDVFDGESGPQDIEVYGYLRASSASGNRYLNLAAWNQQAPECPDDTYHPFLETADTSACPKQLASGTYNLDNMALCESNTYHTCGPAGWKSNNNIIRLTIADQDSLTLSVKIIDWDDAFGNDLVCQGDLQIPSKSIFDWSEVQNLPFSISSSGSESGSCQIIGAMNAVSPP